MAEIYVDIKRLKEQSRETEKIAKELQSIKEQLEQKSKSMDSLGVGFKEIRKTLQQIVAKVAEEEREMKQYRTTFKQIVKTYEETEEKIESGNKKEKMKTMPVLAGKKADMQLEKDMAFVDSILSKDASEITFDEYYAIAQLLGKQPAGDTRLAEYILNRPDCWMFVDSTVWREGNSPDNLIPGQLSLGVFVPTEKYQALSAVLSLYALEVAMEKPENAKGTPYIAFMDNVVMYEQLFRGIVANTDKNEWGYITGSGQEEDMVNTYIGEMYQLTWEKDGLTATVTGEFGTNKIVSHPLVDKDAAADALSDMQNKYINNFLGLDKSGIEVGTQAVIDGIINDLKGKVLNVNPYVQIVADAIGAGYEQEEKQSIIYEYEKWGDFSNTFGLLELGYSSCECSYGDSAPTVMISPYPGNETMETLNLLNDFLESDEGKSVIAPKIMRQIPDGGFTLDYVLNNLEETNKLLDSLNNQVTGKEPKYANSLSEAIGKK